MPATSDCMTPLDGHRLQIVKEDRAQGGRGAVAGPWGSIVNLRQLQPDS